MRMSRQKYQLIPSRGIDDQRFLEFNWNRGTPGHVQPVLDAQMLPSLDDHPHSKNQRYW